MPDFLRVYEAVPGTSLDWVFIFTLVAVATFYFLAPVLGYQSSSRGMLQISLYLHLGYAVLVLFEGALLYICYLATKEPQTLAITVYNTAAVIGILRLVLYIAALATLVLGLTKLQRSSDR